jgi:hypothetical protein
LATTFFAGAFFTTFLAATLFTGAFLAGALLVAPQMVSTISRVTT